MIYIGFEEEWKPVIINGVDTKYTVSNLGQVKNPKDQILAGFKPIKTQNYIYIELKYYNNNIKETKYKAVSRLVADAFIPIPQKYLDMGYTAEELEVDHIRDGDENNQLDNSVFNLQWLTKKENIKKAKQAGLYSKEGITKGIKKPGTGLVGESNGHSKYDEKIVHEICQEISKDELTMKEISEKFNVTLSFVNDLKLGRAWPHITKIYNLHNHTYDQISDKDLYKKIDLMVGMGISNEEIYRVLDMKGNKKVADYISRAKKRHGKEIQDRTSYTKEQLELLDNMIIENKSTKEIMEAVGITTIEKAYVLVSAHKRKLRKAGKI